MIASLEPVAGEAIRDGRREEGERACHQDQIQHGISFHVIAPQTTRYARLSLDAYQPMRVRTPQSGATLAVGFRDGRKAGFIGIP
jgi:hypothetical protein